jgi:calcineurin-like phosphoesterase family protein
MNEVKEIKKWAVSDTHFDHSNVIHYCKRPFSRHCEKCDGEGFVWNSHIKALAQFKLCRVCSGYGVEPFVEEMNEALIENWNSLIAPHDQVYLIGDFVFGDKKRASQLCKILNGNIFWIYGNHDKATRGSKGFAFQGDYKEIKHKGHNIVLSHYPFLTWNKSGRGSICLHGHCHGTLQDDGVSLRYDAGVDCWDLKPVNLDVIVEMAEARMVNNLKTIGKKIWSADHH